MAVSRFGYDTNGRAIRIAYETKCSSCNTITSIQFSDGNVTSRNCKCTVEKYKGAGDSCMIEVAAGVIKELREDGVYFLCGLRSKEMGYGGVWEFPGGKIEPGEDMRDAIKREIQEELDVETGHVSFMSFMSVIETNQNGRTYRVSFVNVRLKMGEIPKALEHEELRWVRRDRLDEIPWASTQYPVIEYIMTRGL